MSQDKCSSCGASVSASALVCGFCGTPAEGKIKSVSDGQSATEMLEALENNLDALHALPRPKPQSTFYAAFYWYVVLATFTLARSLLRKPKKVNPDAFDNLKRTIKRNISTLELIAKGDDVIQQRVRLLKDELADADANMEKARKHQMIARGSLGLLFVLALLMPQPPKVEPAPDNDVAPTGNDALVVKVAETKESGKAWDVGKGMPDVAICYTLDDTQYCANGKPSNPQPKCKNTNTCKFGGLALPEGEFELQILDVDAGNDDNIGQGSCARGKTCTIGQATVTVAP